MESDSETEESVAIARTYEKMKTNVHKIGFVEGLTSGKEAAFQTGFDNGYKEGFESGFQLGKLNGVLRVLQENSRDDETLAEVVRNIPLEQNTKRGMCLLCIPQNVELNSENSSNSEDSKTSSLECNLKMQKKTMVHAICTHLSKVGKAYELYNIPVPTNILDSELIKKNIEL